MEGNFRNSCDVLLLLSLVGLIFFQLVRVANYSKHLCHLATALMVFKLMVTTTTAGEKQEVLVADRSHQVVIFPNPLPTGRDVTKSELGKQARGAELVLM